MESKEDLYEQGVSLALEDRFEEAIPFYKKAIEIDPGYSDVWHALINAYSSLNDFDHGIEAARALIERYPEDILAHSSLSMLYMKKGMKKEAEEAGAAAKLLGFKQMMKESTSGDPSKKLI